MLIQIPVIRCRNPKCPLKDHTPLPFPNHLETTEPRPDWPKDDWKAYLVCRGCGYVDHFGKESVEWGAVQLSLDQMYWANNSMQRISLKCDHENCESPIELLANVPKGERIADVLKRIGDSKNVVICSNGHNLLQPWKVIQTEAALIS